MTAPAVLFDLDGVLADSRATITRGTRAALAERGHRDPGVARIAAMIGPPLQVAYAELLGLDPADAEVAACVGAYRARYRLLLHETPGFPGMAEALDALAAAGLRLGVATSKPLPFAEPVLAALGLRERFAVVEGPSFDGTEFKTATLGRALAALGSRTLALVGDRSHDVEAAHAHGLVAVGVTWGIGTRAELETAGADAIVDTPPALVEVVLALAGSNGRVAGARDG